MKVINVTKEYLQTEDELVKVFKVWILCPPKGFILSLWRKKNPLKIW